MKNLKIILIAIIVFVILASSIAGYFILIKGKNKIKIPVETSEEETQNVKEISAEDIGLSLNLRADEKAVIMKITNLSGIASFEYEMEYMAEVVESGKTVEVPRGVVSSPVVVKSGEKQISKEILLGTCSKNVCKYDKVVSEIKLVMKVEFENGEIGSVEEIVSL